MVVKSRSVVKPYVMKSGTDTNPSPPLVVYPQTEARDSLVETMADSSVSGSARTDNDAVDRFLADPTNRGDFHKALRESAKRAGDLGLADFRVDRTVERVHPWSGSLRGVTGGSPPNVYSEIKNFSVRPSSYSLSLFPTISVRSHPDSVQLNRLGQQMYLSAMPNRTQVELGTALAEVAVNPLQALTVPGTAIAKRWAKSSPKSRAEIIRRARERREQLARLSKEDARAAASDYLAYIFGAQPNLSILDQLAEQISRSRHYAEIVSRQGWRRVRRRRGPRTYTDTASLTTHGSWLHQSLGNIWMLTGPRTLTHSIEQSVWWSGSFRMQTTDTDTWLAQSRDFFTSLDILYGLGVDVKMAWDLVPFSFIADWFSNTGSFLENRELIRDYNIACEYGYVMCHTRETYQAQFDGYLERYPRTGSSMSFWGTSGASFSYQRLQETKQRAMCSSYGFYTDFSALNPYQWSALSALGLVNAPGKPPSRRS